jgi:hypothetical protein
MGGRELSKTLIKYASEIQPDLDIVECGCWLGSGTAHLCLGLKQTGRNNKIWCYDRWRATESEVEKAEKQGVNLQMGQDTLPLVKTSLEPFGADIEFIQGNIKQKDYNGNKIGIYIDDVNKSQDKFDHAMAVFEPFFIPQITVLVLMDYFYYEKKPHNCYQRDWMIANLSRFLYLERPRTDISAAIFLYIGSGEE